MTDNVDRPDDADWVIEAIESFVHAIRTAGVARVEAYDHDQQLAKIQPVVTFARIDDDDKRVLYNVDAIDNVKMVFPAVLGRGLTFPIDADGDTFVLYVVLDRSYDEWFAGGGAGVDAEDPRRHDLTDAVAIPAITPFSAVFPSTMIDAIATVLNGDPVKLGSSAAVKPLSLAPETATNFADLVTTLTPMIAAFNIAPAGTPMVTLGPGGVLPFVPTPTAAGKVLGE